MIVATSSGAARDPRRSISASGTPAPSSTRRPIAPSSMHSTGPRPGTRSRIASTVLAAQIAKSSSVHS